jgi:hypothetical protein
MISLNIGWIVAVELIGYHIGQFGGIDLSKLFIGILIVPIPRMNYGLRVSTVNDVSYRNQS